MTPIQCYQAYVAVKAHFRNPDFDFFRYNGKTRLKAESYDARADTFHFERLANHYDIIGLLVAHLVENPEAWIGDIVRDQGPYLERRKVTDALTMEFTQDLEAFEDIDAVLRATEHQVPGLILLYLGGDISLETASIINDITGVSRVWRKNPMIESVCLRLEKYQPFLVRATHGGYSRDKYQKIIDDKFFTNKS